VGRYYSEITVEKLCMVTEGLEDRLERANRMRREKQRHVDRSLLVQGLQQRVQEWLMSSGDKEWRIPEESTLRAWFKESLREAIAVTRVDASEQEDEQNSSEDDHLETSDDDDDDEEEEEDNENAGSSE
jgi:16S rRNA C967 or C1407 C5-methylase (RsmB/RsmF family)